MFSFIEIVISCIGLFGVFTNNFVCMLIGLIGIIVCDFIDIFITGHNSTTIFLVVILGIGASIANKNPLNTFTLLLCGENLLMSIFTILFITISFIISKFKEKIENKRELNVAKQSENMTSNNTEKISEIINDSQRLNNILEGKETIEAELFINTKNPYTNKKIDNYDDIIEYLNMYKLDSNNINPLTYIKK